MKQDSTVHNLTDGSVRRQLTRYALPMVAISLLQALYSMTDIIISGHFVGNVGISAINNSGQVLGIVTNIAIGVTMGGNILISQFFGAGDQDRRKRGHRHAVFPFPAAGGFRRRAADRFSPVPCW